MLLFVKISHLNKTFMMQHVRLFCGKIFSCKIKNFFQKVKDSPVLTFCQSETVLNFKGVALGEWYSFPPTEHWNAGGLSLSKPLKTEILHFNMPRRVISQYPFLILQKSYPGKKFWIQHWSRTLEIGFHAQETNDFF